MYKHILIATDGSELARKAVAAGLELAKQLKCKVTAVTVTEPWAAVVPPEAALGFPPADYEKTSAENASRILAGVSEQARGAGVDCAGVYVKDQYPADGILDTARKNDCDLLRGQDTLKRGPIAVGRILAAVVQSHIGPQVADDLGGRGEGIVGYRTNVARPHP